MPCKCTPIADSESPEAYLLNSEEWFEPCSANPSVTGSQKVMNPPINAFIYSAD
jgi:hypothetical protein